MAGPRESSIYLPSEIDLNAITFSQPRQLEKTGGKMIYLYHNKKPLVMQIPMMYAPYGMNQWPLDGPATKYNIDVSFQGHENDPNISSLLEVMCNFDSTIVQAGMTNSLTWLKEKISNAEVMKAKYTPMVKYSKNEHGEISNKYPPTFRFQIPFKDGQFMCDTYNLNKELMDLSDLVTKRARVSALLQCNGIYVAGGKIGCTWKAIQMRIIPGSTPIPKGYAFLEDDEDVSAQ